MYNNNKLYDEAIKVAILWWQEISFLISKLVLEHDYKKSLQRGYTKLKQKKSYPH